MSDTTTNGSYVHNHDDGTYEVFLETAFERGEEGDHENNTFLDVLLCYDADDETVIEVVEVTVSNYNGDILSESGELTDAEHNKLVEMCRDQLESAWLDAMDLRENGV